MNIAITGATGFVGTNLIEKLRLSKFRYATFDRTKNNLFNPDTLRSLLMGKDVVIHLAGVNKDAKVKDAIKTNILGTKKLLDAVVRYCPNAKFIFASSFQVYDEDDIFGLSKWAAEDLIEDYVNNRLISNATVLRFSNIYGKGCKPFRNSAVSTFAHLIKKGKEISVSGTGEQTRDFLYIDDAIEALFKAIIFNTKNSFEVIDICSGKLTSINNLLKTLEKISDKKILIRYNESNQKAKKIVRSYQRAIKLLGWQPMVKLEEGLKRLMIKKI